MTKQRESFTTRQAFATLNAKLVLKRQTFTDGRDPVTTLQGYPILWNELSSDRGGYVVRLIKDAAQFTTPTMALFHHDFKAVLGNTANQTLRILAADDTGIPVEIDLPNTTVANDVAELVSKGYITGMSFSMANGFEDYTEEKKGDQFIINVSKFTCDEVTITGIPAFTGTSIGVKPEEEDNKPAPARIAAAARLHSLRLAMLAN
jgi:hypothetical protein